MSHFVRSVVISILFYFMSGVYLDKRWSMVRYITKHGYPVETHKIETKDGYILKTQRIPHGKSSNKTNENVILLVHGMGGCAENYIALGPDDALAFLLADRGFDVWLFNARGSFHSRKHKTKNANFFQGAEFWNFSWHEIGIYDLPANIDYILQKTNKADLFYIGHSQGGTSYLVMTSEKPDYNNKIRAAALLAPAALLQYTEHVLIKILSRFYFLLERVFNMLNYHELVIPNSPILNMVLKQFCLSSDEFKETCMDFVMFFMGGGKSGLINLSLIPFILEFAPSGLATRQAFHYLQIVKSGYFRQYDHGTTKNLIKYNNTIPPVYNLNNSVAPVVLFMANGDDIVTIKATQELSKILPNVVATYEVPYDNFNHVDYVVAYNAKELVFEPVYEFLKQFVKK